METKTEIWKDIEGYEGIYQVSNLGRVKRLERDVPQYNHGHLQYQHINEKILKMRPTKGGYMLILLRGAQDGIRRGFSVHRLVAKAFIPNPDNLPQVNHKNEIRTDNRAENLEWCTNYYNMHYGKCQQRIYKGQHFKPVDVYTKDGKFLSHYESLVKASKATGVPTGTVSWICQGTVRNGIKRQTAKGYRFKYSD
jgi:hypothetical protein